MDVLGLQTTCKQCSYKKSEHDLHTCDYCQNVICSGCGGRIAEKGLICNGCFFEGLDSEEKRKVWHQWSALKARVPEEAASASKTAKTEANQDFSAHGACAAPAGDVLSDAGRGCNKADSWKASSEIRLAMQKLTTSGGYIQDGWLYYDSRLMAKLHNVSSHEPECDESAPLTGSTGGRKKRKIQHPVFSREYWADKHVDEKKAHFQYLSGSIGRTLCWAAFDGETQAALTDAVSQGLEYVEHEGHHGKYTYHLINHTNAETSQAILEKTRREVATFVNKGYSGLEEDMPEIIGYQINSKSVIRPIKFAAASSISATSAASATSAV